MSNSSSIDWRPTATRATLERRARLLQQLRAFFFSQGILEVETPLLSPSATTEVHLQSFEVRAPGAPGPVGYLHTSPELAMKRLLAADYGSMYQIAKVFRAGERGPRHNPEFTLLEWYRTEADYPGFIAENLRLLEELLRPYLRLEAALQYSYRQAFVDYAGVDPFEADTGQLRAAYLAQSATDVTAIPNQDRHAWLDLLLTQRIEPRLPRDRLIVIAEYPADQACLARVSSTTPAVAERFEIYCNGLELANGFHELSDANEQCRRIDRELNERRQRGLPQVPVDQPFIRALQQGLPDCCGIAIGFDRLVMLAAGVDAIDKVIAFV